MRQLRWSLLFLLAALHALPAAEQSSTTRIPEISSAAEAYQKAGAAIYAMQMQRSTKVTKDYGVALEQLRKEITATGDLEASLAVKKEQERVAKREDTSDDQKKAMTGKLLVLRAAYDREAEPFREAAKKEKAAAVAKFVADIEAVEQRLAKANHPDRAALIKALREKILEKGEVPDQPDHPNVPSAPIGAEKLDAALAAKIKTAIAAKQAKHTTGTRKGTDGWPDLPADGAVVVGFELSEMNWGDATAVKTLRPIFLGEKGTYTGLLRGKGPGKITTVRAKQGFAVSGLNTYAGERLLGFQIVFSKIDSAGGKVLAGPQMSYTSKWYGTKGKGAPLELGGSGKLLIGLWGNSGADVDSLGAYELP